MRYLVSPDQEKMKAVFAGLNLSDAELASLKLLSVTGIVVDSGDGSWQVEFEGRCEPSLLARVADELMKHFEVQVTCVVLPSDGEAAVPAEVCGVKSTTEAAAPAEAAGVMSAAVGVASAEVSAAAVEAGVNLSDVPLPPEPLEETVCENAGSSADVEFGTVDPEGEAEFQAACALLRREQKGEAADGVIFGRLPKGKVRTLDTVTEEENKVTVEGHYVRILDRDGNLQTFAESVLRTGAIVLLFNVADAKNGIYVRIRFPLGKPEGDYGAAARKECNEFKVKLKEGMYLRLQGNVERDKFRNDELVLVPTGIQVIPSPYVRKDEAPEKRVELHCHTKMSKMDGVTGMKELVRRAVEWDHPALAITDHGVVQAFPFCMDALDEENKSLESRKLPPSRLKLIYGMEGYLVGDQKNDLDIDQEAGDEDGKAKRKARVPNFHIILLARNEAGLRNLYKLVTISHLRYINRNPLLHREIILEHREGLLIGSACEAGELYRAILRGAGDEELLEIARFYDFLEIQPLGNNMFLVRSGRCTEEQLKEYNRKIIALAKQLGKPVVATGDVHFLNPEDAEVRTVLQAAQGYEDAEQQAPLYFRTTEEMLAEFSYLGPELAKEVVITNPQKVADMIERFRPVPDRDQLYSPHIQGVDQQIYDMAYARAKELYGDPLPQLVDDRLKLELDSIIGHGFAVLYYIAHKLVKRSLEIHYLVGSRGSVGSSFVANMIDITEVNALPPHYRCPKCRHTEFFLKGEWDSGFDMPVKACPECGTEMVRDGHNIPFAVFMGFHGDKVPDIDLNFSEVAQHYAHEYTKELFGKDNVCRAGTISTVANKMALGYCLHYYDDKHCHAHPAKVAHIVQRLQGVKKTTGQHPGGIMVVPRNMDIHYITPMNFPSNEKKSKINIMGLTDPPTITTHYDYHSINDRLVKLDILGHDDPGMLRHLELIIPGLDVRKIPIGDPETMALFTGTESLGVTSEQIGSEVGTFGVPECGTKFVRQMIADVKPRTFSEVVRVSGYSHGTDVWLNNAQDLIREGKPVKQTISTRDDVMTHLIQAGVEPALAFKTMEYVRKGNAAKKGLEPAMKEAMKKANIPDWYMHSCETIQYLFPKAHAVAYVLMAYRIAYCKVHYPKQFYAAYFSERADLFDVTLVMKGKQFIKNYIQEINELGFRADPKVAASLPYLELVVEMMERGIQFEPMNLYTCQSGDFVITDKGLIPPFSSVPGVGAEAAKKLAAAVAEARKSNTRFISQEDLAQRSGVGQSVLDKLSEIGVLGDLPKSSQTSLFDF